jgi:hypothetical protein
MLMLKHKQDSQRQKPVWTVARFDLRAKPNQQGKAVERELPRHPLVQISFLTPPEIP